MGFWGPEFCAPKKPCVDVWVDHCPRAEPSTDEAMPCSPRGKLSDSVKGLTNDPCLQIPSRHHEHLLQVSVQVLGFICTWMY